MSIVGWTETYKPKGQSMEDFTRHEFPQSSVNFVAFASTLTAAYVAYRTKEGGITCLVIALKQYRLTADGYNICYKEMDENTGPRESACPERILSLLTLTTNQYALDWRKRCWDAIEKRRGAAKVGQTIRLEKPLKFTDGSEQDTFVVSAGRH